MELNSDLGKQIINKLNGADWVSFNDLIDIVCNKYSDLIEEHQLYIKQDPETFEYTAGLYFGKKPESYTKEQLLSFFITFSNLSIEIKQFLNILEYLKAFNYANGLRSQPNLTIINPIVWSKGNPDSQTDVFMSVSDPELFRQLVSNHALSYKKTPQLDKLIERDYLEEDEYRFRKSLNHSIWNLRIASAVGLIALATLFYTFKQLKNIDTVVIEESQYIEMKESLDSIEHHLTKTISLNKLDSLKNLTEIELQLKDIKEELERQTRKLNKPVKVTLE